MKCPHCGNYVPVPLNQPPVRIPDLTPPRPRWPMAREFMSLIWALDGNMNDAVLLCLLAEDHVSQRKSSKRSLAERSGGTVSREAITRLKRRVAEGQVPQVIKQADDEEDGEILVDLPLMRRLAEEQVASVDPNFLWLYELTDSSFRDALVLSLLLQAGADKEPKKLTGRELVELSGGLYTYTREIYRALHRLSPIYGGGLVQRPEYRYWSIDTKMLNERLAQQGCAWLERGAPADPWEAGLRMALAGSPDADRS